MSIEHSGVRAVAHPNIALVKYWGKAERSGNVPAVPSLSITLDTLTSDTTVTLIDGPDDVIQLNGEPARPAVADRVSAFVDLVRAQADDTRRVSVATVNNFPTASGLASSASGFAALALAATRAFAMTLNGTALSALARQGSGSAARSLYGGFVEMAGPDAASPAAHQIVPEHVWPLEVVVAVTTTGQKRHLSTDGMNLTRDTSPYYRAWIDSHVADMGDARSALDDRNFPALARVSEHSCLKMHGLMLSSEPGLIYWNPATLSCIERVRALRADGLDVFFTIDAGAQVKAVCTPESAASVRAALDELPGVVETLHVGLGGDARIVD
ncbi:MAG: diphosphomevalonate decarboxylase [Pseudomonadota bacterium]